MTHHRRHGNNDTGTYDAEMTTALSPAQRYAAFKQTQAKRQSVSSRFARSMPFELDDFQVKANDALEAGDNVLVAAPTGAGKTVVADFAIYLAQERNVKAFYTTPIKALSNQKYHDLKHQINILKTQSYTGKSTSYLEKMEREIRVYETQNKTGNQILDAVLTNKAMICQNKEIELKFIVDGEALSFMDDMDVSALFGNMLDNAIESAEKQQEKQKRLIWLYVTREKQFVRIRTENYCDEKIHFKNGMPVTTKKDRRLHGYGMKSIKSTVEKYHGSVVAAQENNWFELKILLPAGR